MDKAQTDLDLEAPAAPVEERAARHLRLLARMADIQMEVAEATRTEAVTAPQPGIDYCQRLSVVARSLRLTVLLEDKFSRPPVERPQKAAAGQAGAADRSRSRLRVTMAMGAAALDGAETAEGAEAERLFAEMAERLERPELAELVETCPPPVAVARLCRKFGLPEETERWLELGDAGLAELATRPPPRAQPRPRPLPQPWTRQRSGAGCGSSWRWAPRSRPGPGTMRRATAASSIWPRRWTGRSWWRSPTIARQWTPWP